MKQILLICFLSLRCFAAEPAIHCLTLSQPLSLGNKNINMTANMTINPEITTVAGTQLFSYGANGVTVQKSGLYRVSFFQRILGNTSDASCLTLLVIPPVIIKRDLGVTIAPSTVTEISFTQILRLQSGQTIDVILRPYSGSLDLLPGAESSGFIIEEIH